MCPTVVPRQSILQQQSKAIGMPLVLSIITRHLIPRHAGPVPAELIELSTSGSYDNANPYDWIEARLARGKKSMPGQIELAGGSSRWLRVFASEAGPASSEARLCTGQAATRILQLYRYLARDTAVVQP